MQRETEAIPRYYLSTLDLLLMAALAGLGGVASTAVNALGDATQALLGFAGTTQWAAGLHVVVLLLAASLTGKVGAATLTGLLKGGVELLSGNTHGLIVLLVDLAAGLAVDLVLLPWRRKDALPAHLSAGAVSAASNVFVFQWFASAPEDILAFIWGIAALAAASGALLGGALAHSLLTLLRRNGLAPRRPAVGGGWRAGAFLGVGVAVTVALGAYLGQALAGPPVVRLEGALATPMAFHAGWEGLTPRTLELELQGMKRRATGYPLREVLAVAGPGDYGAVLVSATDGYSFFITRREVEANDALLLAYRGEGEDLHYEIAGAENAKAWVRNVSEIRLVPQTLVEVRGRVERPFPFNPDDWVDEMDNARLDLGAGEAKYQGVVLADVLTRWEPSSNATEVRLAGRDGSVATLPLARALEERAWRLWVVTGGAELRYAVASADGEVLAADLVAIELR